MALNYVLRGWANSYKYAEDATKVLPEIQHFAWHRITHWLAEKHECSRKYLVENILAHTDPLKVEGVELAYIADMSTRYTEPRTDTPHPYLDGERSDKNILPEEAGWLALQEERDGRKTGGWTSDGRPWKETRYGEICTPGSGRGLGETALGYKEIR